MRTRNEIFKEKEREKLESLKEIVKIKSFSKIFYFKLGITLKLLFSLLGMICIVDILIDSYSRIGLFLSLAIIIHIIFYFYNRNNIEGFFSFLANNRFINSISLFNFTKSSNYNKDELKDFHKLENDCDGIEMNRYFNEKNAIFFYHIFMLFIHSFFILTFSYIIEVILFISFGNSLFPEDFHLKLSIAVILLIGTFMFISFGKKCVKES